MQEIQPYLDDIDKNGYTVIKNVLSQDQIDNLLQLVKKFDQESDDSKYLNRPHYTLNDKFVFNLQNKHKDFIDVLDTPVIQSILQTKLNDPFYKYLPKEHPNYILSYYNARSSGAPLAMHTDTFLPSVDHRTWLMQAFFVLEDADEENGTTVVVPGSHKSGVFIDRDKEMNLVPLVAKAGDVVVLDSRLYHGTAENASDRTRWFLIATFSCWWVKQRTDMTKSIPNHIYQQLTDQQKVLMGFSSLPPYDEYERLNFKAGYEVFPDSIPEKETADV